MMRFDLSALASFRARRMRPFRVVWTAGTVIFVLIASLIALVGTKAAATHPLDLTQGIVLSVLLTGFFGGAGLMTYAVWKAGPGVLGLTIDDSGLQFIWGSGSVDHLGWDKLTSGFVLLDYSSNDFLRSKAPSRLWEVRRWRRPPTYITKEAFDAILTKGSTHGLVTQSRFLPSPSWGWAVCVETRFSFNPANSLKPQAVPDRV
jgi:hypothetical protein